METDANRLKLTNSVTSGEPGGNVVVVRRFTADRDKLRTCRSVGVATQRCSGPEEPSLQLPAPVRSSPTIPLIGRLY